MIPLEQRIFDAQPENFEALALEVFAFQYAHCPVYREFVDLLGRPKPQALIEIPFLPISFFKTHDVLCEVHQPELCFKSSGTTGMERSRHLVAKASLYRQSFMAAYRKFLGNPEEQVILALLPSYLEQGESSLVYMVDELIRVSNNPLSGFYKDQLHELLLAAENGRKANKQVVIFGVSYALLDLAELGIALPDAIIIETGGMKGRRKEMTKEALHEHLSGVFKAAICSEYGMTELLSQGYSLHDGLFDLPPWLRILIHDANDPFGYLPEGRTGGIHVIDLANLYSCAFIATQDLGQIQKSGQLKLMGRFDLADLRGCNLLVE